LLTANGCQFPTIQAAGSAIPVRLSIVPTRNTEHTGLMEQKNTKIKPLSIYIQKTQNKWENTKDL